MRNSNRLQVLHDTDYVLVREGVETVENDVADLDLGAFINGKRDIYAARRHLAQLRCDSSVLVAALGFIFLKNVAGTLHFAGIVLGFRRQADVALFEAVENFGFADGLVARVVDGVDGAAFGDEEGEDDATLGPL